MRIGFLNPWRVAAENQAFSSLRIAAERIGHELIHCANSAEVEDCAPDFVLASASTQPKLNDVPHYGAIHEPRDRFLGNRAYFHNLVSYDGYLTIADTLDKFLRDLTFGQQRDVPVGFYYNTCQRQNQASGLQSLISRRALRITYFGTNWDKRRQAFFQKLSASEGVQICGPEHSWPHISPTGYGGPVPFDGVSVQSRYAQNGIGLCMLSDTHLRDDIISNRIFEITSVGAIAFCCDIPWIRKHFGDNVFYFDQHGDDDSLCEAILKLQDAVYDNPGAAIRKATRAREIFEAKFAAEVLLANAVRYHEERVSERRKVLQDAERRYCPLISVITRCGSRPLDYIKRAVESVARQSYGRFEVIFVRHRDIDLAPLNVGSFPRIVSFRAVDCMGGNRSACMWAGLRAVQGEYFSVLDDDDWWFSDHFERLFQPLPENPLRRFLGYSGTIVVRRDPEPIMGGSCDNRELHRFGIQSMKTWSEATSAFASNCFVASRDLLHSRLLISPEMETAEDSYLILSLLEQAEPRFSYAATALYDRSLADQSDFSAHPRRFDDELTLQLRLLGRDRPGFVEVDTWKPMSEFWSRRQAAESARTEEDVQAEIQAILRDWDQVAGGYDLPRSRVSLKSCFVDSQAGSATIQTPREPWSYGATLHLPQPSRPAREYALIAEVLVRQGTVGLGILNLKETDFLFRQTLSAGTQPQIVRIPIEDLHQTGRFVIQNWETPGESLVDLISLRLMAEPL